MKGHSFLTGRALAWEITVGVRNWMARAGTPEQVRVTNRHLVALALPMTWPLCGRDRGWREQAPGFIHKANSVWSPRPEPKHRGNQVVQKMCVLDLQRAWGVSFAYEVESLETLKHQGG